MTAYRADLVAFLQFIAAHWGEPVPPAAWPACARPTCAHSRHPNAAGVWARGSLARRMSGVRSFLRWISDREGLDLSAALSTRSPKYSRSLPRPLTPLQAQDTLDRVADHATPWVGARDLAGADPAVGIGGCASPRRWRWRVRTGPFRKG